VDGKCLRGTKRPDGSQIYVISAVRHHNRLTAAAREIAAKPNDDQCWQRRPVRRLRVLGQRGRHARRAGRGLLC
jgi:hypothetical protein